jgi:hypothetical protein
MKDANGTTKLFPNYNAWETIICLTTESKTNKPTNKQTILPYRQFVNAWPMKNLAELADGPTVYARCQGQAFCCVRSANPLSPSLYKKLALSLPPDNFTSQKVTNEVHHLSVRLGLHNWQS